MEKTQKKQSNHIVVGVLAGSFHSDYAKKLVSDLCDRFEEDDAEIHLYCGMDSSRYLPKYYGDREWIDPQYYSIYGYANFDRLDVLIISYDTINDSKNTLDIREFLSNLPDVPKILVGEKNAGQDIISIVMDDYHGMKENVDHLIEAHGCRKICYLSGSPKIANAQHRLSAYQDSMAEHGLPVELSMIAYGNFTSHCSEQADVLLEQNPDAIVTANDEMAVCIYERMKLRNLVPGEDILVSGFDDIPIARAMNPPLTTMRQDMDELVECIYQQAIKLAQGEKAVSRELSVKFIPRCSCGCQKEYERQPEEKNDARSSMLFTEYNDLKRTHKRELEINILLKSLLMYPVTVKDFFLQFGKQLRLLDVNHSVVTLLEEPVVLQNGDHMFVPQEQKLVMVLNPRNIHAYQLEGADILYRNQRETENARRHIINKNRGIFCTFLLSYEEIQYGAWMVKLNLSDVMFYYNLSLSLSVAIRYLHLALNQQRMVEKLEEQNQILNFSSSHDSMTELYNRAGFMKHLLSAVRKKPKDTVYVLLIGDLDHLKQINDTFGHEDGDFAIRKSAEILKSVVNGYGSTGRFGGDEFVCFFEKTEELDGEKAVSRIQSLCQEFNKQNRKPYYIGISTGYQEFTAEDISNINGIIKQADAKLYENKKKRRSNVIRLC